MAWDNSLLGRLFLILDSRTVHAFYTTLLTRLSPPSEGMCPSLWTEEFPNLRNRLRATERRVCRASHRAIVSIGVNPTHVPELVYYNCAIFLLSLNRESLASCRSELLIILTR